MRADVKFGVVISLVVVLIAGGYFMARERDEQPIPLNNSRLVTTDKDSQPKKPVSQRAKRSATPLRRAPSTQPSAQQPGKIAGSRNAQRGSTPKRRLATAPGGSSRRSAEKPAANSPSASKSATGRRATGSLGSKGSRQAKPTTIVAKSKGSSTKRPVRNKGQAGVANLASASPGGENARRTEATPQRLASVVDGDEPSRGVVQSGSSSPLADTTLSAMPAPAAAIETHRIQPGDTLASLSLMYYGSERYVGFLTSANPQLSNPNTLRIGALVRIPSLPDSSASNRSSSPSLSVGATQDRSSTNRSSDDAHTYRVKPGDSFYVIARDVLGDAKRWKELFELNRELVKGDATRLQVGQVIKLRK